jgi:hypothetical protein
MFHSSKFKRLPSQAAISRADNIVGTNRRRQARQEKASDNLPDEILFLSWRPWRLGG